MESKNLKLTPEEIRSAFGSAPPMMTLEKLSEVVGLKVRTLREWIARGYLEGTFRKRGKYLLFVRDRVIAKLFNGPEWQTPS